MAGRPLFAPELRWPNLGLNYGNDMVWEFNFRAELVEADLRDIRRHFSKLRIYIPAPNNPSWVIDHCLVVIDKAKELGFRVIWGISSNGTTLTAANWPAYQTKMIEWASLAQTHGVDEFTIGNEEEVRVDGTTLNTTQLRNNLKAAVPSVKAVFSGVISYTVSDNNIDGWVNEGMGTGLDRLAMNTYGADQYNLRYFIYKNAMAIKAFGAKMYISEVNVFWDWQQVGMDNDAQQNYLQQRIAILKKMGYQDIYFFLYSHRSTDNFALKLASGDYRAMWYALVNERRAVVNIPNQAVSTLRPTLNRTTISSRQPIS